jgi:transposase
MKAIRIPAPAPTDLAELDALYRSTRDARLRTRIQIVLLSMEQGLPAAAIARIVRESEQTVRNWLKRYLAEGSRGLHDRPRPGAPPKSTTAYKARLLVIVRQRPRSLGQPYSLWTLPRLADYLAEETGIRVDPETVRVYLKAADIVLSRPQHTISSPDPDYQVKKRRSKQRATS